LVGKIFKYTFFGGLMLTLVSIIFPSSAGINDFFGGLSIPDNYDLHLDDTIKDVNLQYPIPSGNVNPTEDKDRSPLYGSDPSNVKTEIIYDPETNEYLFIKKVGDDIYDTPYPVSFDEYLDYDFDNAMKSYWRQRSKSDVSERRDTFIPKLEVGGEIFDRIFGGNTININPRGSAELTLGIKYNNTNTPGLSKRERRNTTFTFKESINMSVIGQIGDKMKVDIKYDTEAAFDFQNSVKLEYTGNEDEIIQKIEAGNVSLPLSGTLISGGQSLFGFKTELKFGKLTMTGVFSQKKSESSVINVEGGAQTKEFEIKADDYEPNKHYFLSHYFKENYDRALANLPVITSGINITRIEVWVTNRSGNFENSRNIVAFADLGESNDNNIQSSQVIMANGITQTYPPENGINILGTLATNNPSIRDINSVGNVLMGYDMTGGVEYEKIESARLLTSSEYTVNEQLGYISLNSTLTTDQVLAVAFEYTLGGNVYKVGEFSNSAITAPQSLILKLIKGTAFTPQLKTWSLMMRNIYYMRTYQMSSEDFWLDIMYTNDKTGTDINYLPAGKINETRLLTVLNLDNLNSQQDPYPDGVFDYIEGITANSQNGRIIFPVREPFGSYLKGKITGGDPTLNSVANQYVFQELYDSTQSTAQQIAEKNKFKLKGKYKSSGGSEIPLNAIDIPQGSVKVTAGAQELVENVHYTVDYNLGRVKIIDAAILEAGTPLQISLESNSMFNTITKTLVGAHLNYEFSKDFNVGATILNMTEKPLTSKVNIGDEPMSNTIWGVNASYRTDAPFLTKAIDFLPFIETKEMSTLTMTGEFAHLIPGHSRAIEKDGNAYIDDFEGSKTSYDIKYFSGWSLASTPTDSVMFPEGRLSNDLRYGYNRAKLAWYYINSSFYDNSRVVNNEQLSSHYVRQIYEKEIFPNRENANGNYPNVLNALNLAFYPKEKGPYNYNVQDLGADGLFTNPQTKWGGIMRQLSQKDFEEMNIEYIEFWLMDPFVENENNPGGDLYFNLGDISEDVLKDGRKSFEHGLPTPVNNYPVDTSVWGIISKIQSLTNIFENDAEVLKAQDVGLDGLSDENERFFFSDYLRQIEIKHGAGSPAYQQAYEDPSNDNFHYYLGSDYDSEGFGILERYKKWNGLEGNTPANSNEAGKLTPDVEDINGDYTLNESENYFQYKVSIRKEDLEVGRNFITDKIKVTSTFENDQKSEVEWYQFKIPIYDYEKRIGLIRDFKSIRFMRMFMHNFSDETILRFATLDLVRGEWRKYSDSFLQPGEYIVDELTETPFEVSAVNIEENSKKEPVNYVLPPGITRETSPMSPQLNQLNEQAMSLKVLDLQDGDARAVYKNVSLDVRKYLVLKMFIHAESVPNYPDIDNGDLSVFVRLGTDYKNNYYEYEIPLVVTEPGVYDGSADVNSEDRKAVWPEENNLNLEFSILQDLKQERNERLREGDGSISLTRLYSVMNGDHKVSIMGNPNLANVQTIMIGIRNPKKVSNSGTDDGLSKSGEIWVNELRLSNFDEKGGWAANARVTAKLADFGTVTLAGSTSKPGFGSINQKIGDLQKEEINRYDISANFELGKFFPEKFNVRIPLYMAISENVVNPEYNPLDPDVLFKATLSDPTLSKEEKDSIKRISQEYTKRKSINFNNVKVNKTSGEPRIYDLANWSFSYGYNESFYRDINTEHNINKTYTGSIFYNYNATPKIVEPFKNVNAFKSKHLQILRDFNFYYLPSQISFRTNMNRQYGETQLRNIYSPETPLPESVIKNFIWVRQYDLKYNLSKNLKFEFSATNNARIDEKEGKMHKDLDTYQEMKDTIWQNIKRFGRNTQYHQQWDVTYNIPINKIPIFNWITANARYSGTYDWTASPLLRTDTITLGNTLQNGNVISLNTQFNLLNLYNKIKYLDDVNKKYRGRQTARQPKKEIETVTYTAERVDFKEGRTKNITHGLKTEDVTIKVTTDGRDVRGETVILDKNKVSFTTAEDIANAQIVITGKREKTESFAKKIFDNTLVIIMSVKNVSIGYTQTGGTLLPGYLGETRILGLSHYSPNAEMFGAGLPKILTPTVPFIFGWQDSDFGQWAADNYLITKDTTSIQQFVQTTNKSWTARASIEPFRDLKIDLNSTHTLSLNDSKYYRYSADSLKFFALNPLHSGSFSMSIISIKTAFEPLPKGGDISSKAFENFSRYRVTIAKRLAENRHSKDPGYDPTPGADGFPEGYGKTSQDVLIPAFFAAYTGQDPNKTGLKALPSILSALPNWRITYDGLSKISFIKKYFRTINLSHSYRSTYNIGSFQSRFGDEYSINENTGLNDITNEIGDYYSEYEINGVSITEQLSPLFAIDATMINSFILKVEVKKTRNLNMSFANNQLTDSRDITYTLGTGYRFKDVEIAIKTGGRQRSFKSDLNIRLDFNIREMATAIRKLEEEIDQLTSGSTTYTLKTTADYVLNSRFTIRAYYNHIFNKPKVSTPPQSTTIEFGFTLKFVLAS
jgi:cell surface protein SprA